MIVGVTTVGRPTVRVKEVLLVTPPPAALIVTVNVPAAVEPPAAILRVVEHVGLHEAEEKEALVPVGKPETVKETA